MTLYVYFPKASRMMSYKYGGVRTAYRTDIVSVQKNALKWQWQKGVCGHVRRRSDVNMVTWPRLTPHWSRALADVMRPPLKDICSIKRHHNTYTCRDFTKQYIKATIKVVRTVKFLAQKTLASFFQKMVAAVVKRISLVFLKLSSKAGKRKCETKFLPLQLKAANTLSFKNISCIQCSINLLYCVLYFSIFKLVVGQRGFFTPT
jgi:hypothetical protein